MNDFIDQATRISRTNQAGWASPSFERIWHARRKLQNAYAKSHIDLDNIENFFSTIEMARLIGRIGSFDTEDAAQLPRDLTYVIMRTLEKTIRFPINSDESIVDAPHPYGAFAELIIELNKIRDAGPIAVISFNYDLCIEYALTIRQYGIDYGLQEYPARADSIHLYKVHGSLNWSLSKENSRISVIPPKPIRTVDIWERLGLDRTMEWPIDTMELLHGPDGWGQEIVPRPIIVPPTWNKGKYQDIFSNIWKAASQSLATAENIFVIGYSLPPSDQFFKSFYSISTISDSIIERFWLLDPTDQQAVTDRYRALLGPAILDRGKFYHKHVKFSGAIKAIAEEFGLSISNLPDH